ncbi:hypothetical protein SDRG_07096 [Saprolegnia diclina VS20]|uniref:Dolichyl-diphosphooligosaccharide-protein glycosyltransferase subunit OST5 n=2 Tax=Saprolegnia TaxID=4769 RepID=A0A067BW56_SAPPC|nr:hypothetical protein SDRG_07096 [Saprolegnia diclina VS20]XP_012210467.1 hypothetical protein SPRG_15881 [Saprolegnia parasitica CBS 223.65]EQC35385.1 hypothetical protein SDRG_07096 [Saprolegnia diclina VS20]KDO18832.1 hypothetical protein SPRG_15881 [Saprolegnia parasitica CBS 223.65]|eukprot:XP_008611135.1 hypothetical protein SDRG_07096 [Saprolegnia diclina VS20]
MEFPHTSPVPVDLYGYLAVFLNLIGLVFMAAFFTKGVSANKNMIVELAFAALASLFLGSGSLFVFLWAEIYV